MRGHAALDAAGGWLGVVHTYAELMAGPAEPDALAELVRQAELSEHAAARLEELGRPQESARLWEEAAAAREEATEIAHRHSTPALSRRAVRGGVMRRRRARSALAQLEAALREQGLVIPHPGRIGRTSQGYAPGFAR